VTDEQKNPRSESEGGERPPGLGYARLQRIDSHLLASYDRLLDRYMPPSFLVDENARLLDAFAGAERYLRAKARRPTSNLLDMLDGDVRNVVAEALSRVSRECVSVVCPNVVVETPAGPREHVVRVELVHQPRSDQGHVLVTLESTEGAVVTGTAAEHRELGAVLTLGSEAGVAQVSDEGLQSLEEELSQVREVLRTTLEELEGSNEELLAANKELGASSEKLKSTTEALHSVNEKLYNVNADYQTKLEELHQLNADIGQRRGAEEEVRAAARRRERFLAMLSHELRNPLAAVLNAVRVVGAGGPSETQAKARHVIDRQGRHMARLLDDLLDVSRITSGKFELRKEQVRFADSVMAAIEAVEPILRDLGILLQTSLSQTAVIVDGDGARLQQVVANLLSNAARYSPSGSRVELSLAREGDAAVLSVRDWGTGIESSLLPRIFDLFVQSEQASRQPRGGLGIGLALVRRIVELHDGTVEAKSAGRDLGSEFVVRIPCSCGIERTSSPPDTIPEACRIVLVEDQEDSREMMRALLELRGHSVVEATDGLEAIEVIRRERPDVAVVDIGLPVVSGYDVARSIRGSEDCGKVFLIALTGYGSQSDVRAAEDAGFDAHLTKPAEPDRLFKLLATRQPSIARHASGRFPEVEAH
jgi:signal transduction histidine kinase/CheY-like chemotaxis protein